MLPGARIERVDRDSTAHKNDWAASYQRIGADEIDILVGTQMLAEGHDFARLNLVVVLNADGSLYSADFRAPERLFAELMQVSRPRRPRRCAGQGVDTNPVARAWRVCRHQSAGLPPALPMPSWPSAAFSGCRLSAFRRPYAPMPSISAPPCSFCRK